MGTYHNGYENVKVKLLNAPGDDLAKLVYTFGRLSHDFNYSLVEEYSENHEDCVKLIDKIVEGTTLPKFAKEGLRIEFEIDNISRICLAQLTRDHAIFASASTGVFPLTQEFNIPMSVYKEKDIMDLVKKAEDILEEAYIKCCEREIPTLESRYIGLHSQVISLTASFTITDFVRSCFSRTSSNFCDECNYVYRLMFLALMNHRKENLKDKNSIKLFDWLVNEKNCINDNTYKREHLFNSDFTPDPNYVSKKAAIEDWRKSGWKSELERMYYNGTGYLTQKEVDIIQNWLKDEINGKELKTSYDGTKDYVAKNMIKTRDYYREV